MSNTTKTTAGYLWAPEDCKTEKAYIHDRDYLQRNIDPNRCLKFSESPLDIYYEHRFKEDYENADCETYAKATISDDSVYDKDVEEYVYPVTIDHRYNRIDFIDEIINFADNDENIPKLRGYAFSNTPNTMCGSDVNLGSVSKANCDNSIASNVCAASVSITKGENSIANNTGYMGISKTFETLSVAAATENMSMAIADNDYSVACVTGCNSEAIADDSNSVAVSTGYSGKAMANCCNSIAVASGSESTAYANSSCNIAISTGEDSEAIANAVGSIAIANNYHSSAAANTAGSMAIAADVETMIKGKIGSYLVFNLHTNNDVLNDVKLLKVDGTNIKEDTYYTISAEGELTEVESSDEE